jgi:hypothetical protein
MTINLKDFDNIHDVVAQIVARDVAYSFEMARAANFDVPREYDVGFQRVAVGGPSAAQGEHFKYRLRVNDAMREVTVLIPFLDGRVGLRDVDRLWHTALNGLALCARSMALVWLNKHPETVCHYSEGHDEALRQLKADVAAEMTTVSKTNMFAERAASATFTRVDRK